MTDKKNDDQKIEGTTAVAVDTDTDLDEKNEQAAGKIEEADADADAAAEADADADAAGEADADADADDADADAGGDDADADGADDRSRINWPRVLAYGILPGLALVLAMAAGYLKWQDNSIRDNNDARTASVQAAKDSTITMLSYQPDKVEQQLTAARALLTGQFRENYTRLVNDVVIPGAKQKQITAVAKVPTVASVSADPHHAVALVFVNQTVTVGSDIPTDTASSVRVTMEKVGDRWLISNFEPV